MPTVLPNPCSDHDRDLQEIETLLSTPEQSAQEDVAKLARLVRALTTYLRIHERERVARIYSQI